MALFADESKIKAFQMANLTLLPNLPILQSSVIPINNKPLIRRKNFSPEEDKLLTDLVCKFGSKKWSTIAQYFKYRTARQCRERYNNYLAPTVFKGQWLKEEDDLLYEKYKEIGPKWSKMKSFFNNRSPNLLKNRWKYFVSKYYPQIEKNEQIEKIDININPQNEDSKKCQKNEDKNNDASQDDFQILCDIKVNQQNLFMSLTDFEEIYTYPYLPQPKNEDVGLYQIDFNNP